MTKKCLACGATLVKLHMGMGIFQWKCPTCTKPRKKAGYLPKKMPPRA